MRWVVLLVVWAFISVGATAQATVPGGVQKPVVWLDATADGLVDRLKGRTIAGPGHRESDLPLVNYHPSFSIGDVSHELEVLIDAKDVLSLSIFVVAMSSEADGEFALWSLSDATSLDAVMTTQRLAMLTDTIYASFTDRSRERATLYSYVRQSGNPLTSPRLAFLKTPRDRPLPSEDFRGTLCEVVAYGRTLSEVERIQVETYLAIKYGIARNDGLFDQYLDSQGETIWSTEGEFGNRITGLGTDRRAGLDQRQAHSASAPEILSIALGRHAAGNNENTRALDDGHFVIWADNGAPTVLDREYDANLPGLQRQWKLQTTNGKVVGPTEVMVDSRYFATTDVFESLWLRVWKNGDDPSPHYHKGLRQENGLYRFGGLQWDRDGSGSDFFTFVPGPDFIGHIDLDAPDCRGEKKGVVRLQMFGGQPPFRATVVDLSTGSEVEIMTDSNAVSLDIDIGAYELSVLDAQGARFTREIVLGHRDGPDICLEQVYIMKNGEAEVNNGCAKSQWTHNWTGPGGIRSNAEVLHAKASGRWTLRVSDGVCEAVRSFQVLGGERTAFRRVEVYPNPLAAGAVVNFRVVLEVESMLTYSLVDQAGRILLEQNAGWGQVFVEEVPVPEVPGMYVLVLRSGDITETRQIAVSK